MEPLAYLHLQMRLEGKVPVNTCLLRQVEIVPDEELPLILVARLANQELVTYYNEALSLDLQKELAAAKIEFPNTGTLLEILDLHHIPFEVGHYKTYVFSSRPVVDIDVLCLPKHDARVTSFGFDGFVKEVYAIEHDGSLVSACVSTRENETCGEAWVFTRPEYRKQGFALKAVKGWARGLLAAGKVPFYSHDIKNTASANLARKLGLLPVFEEIAIIQI